MLAYHGYIRASIGPLRVKTQLNIFPTTKQPNILISMEPSMLEAN